MPNARQRVRSSDRYRWYALGAVMLGTVMGPLDASIANVALPTIGRAFHRGVDAVEWVLLAYTIVTASTLVLFGRLGDIVGQKRIYLSGFAVFGSGSLACALAPSLPLLIAARVFQAVGAAMLISCTQAIITEVFPSHERGRAIGLNGAAVAVGLTSGPVLGGFIVSTWDWRWIFTINVPISLIAMAVAAFVLRRETTRPEALDVPGAVLAGAGLFGLSLALSRAHVWGWGSPATGLVLLASGIAFACFVALERRTAQPMLDLTLFRSRTFAFSVVAALLYFIATSGVVFIVPLAAQIALGLRPLRAGLLLLPVSALNVVLAPFAGALSDRVPARYVSTAGAVLYVAGALWLAALPAHPAVWSIAGALVVAGAGTAVFSQPNNSTIMGAAPSNRRGVAAGVLATARTTGQVLGVALAGAVYFGRAAQLAHSPHSFAPATTVFAAVAALMIAAAIVSYTREET